MDPEFRVGEEGEMKLMRADVIRQLLEDCYAEGKEEFLRFVECYAVGNADGGLEDYIEQLYQFSSGYPWPDLWLERCRENLEHGNVTLVYAAKDTAHSHALVLQHWLEPLLAK